MRYFKNTLKYATSVSYFFDNSSYSVTVRSGDTYEFPDTFDGPYSIGVSHEETVVIVGSGEENAERMDIPK